jgi:Putative Flp pilus-assembly TadE/G-like
MNMLQNPISVIRSQQGAIAVLVGISMLTLVGFTALAVDVGYVMTTRNELQNTADAAALAAARELGDIYKENNAYDNSTDRPLILSAAVDIAQKNKAGGLDGININDGDLEIGVWDGSTFTSNTTAPNAVKAITRRDGGANGPISTFFFNILGVNSVDISAQAVAALSSQGTAEYPGPFGISKTLFESAFCDQSIDIYFTEDLIDCAGWHTFEDWPENAETAIEEILTEMNDGTFANPGVKAGDEFVFTGRPVLGAFDEMQALYNEKKDAEGKWRINIVVYDNGEFNGCGTPSPWPNPQTARSIVGFATFTIEDVLQDPEYFDTMTIKGEILCETAEEGRGAGTFSSGDLSYGTMGNIPSLVK